MLMTLRKAPANTGPETVSTNEPVLTSLIYANICEGHFKTYLRKNNRSLVKIKQENCIFYAARILIDKTIQGHFYFCIWMDRFMLSPFFHVSI